MQLQTVLQRQLIQMVLLQIIKCKKQDNLEYEIIYKNNSSKKLQNVKIKDSLPTGTILAVSAAPQRLAETRVVQIALGSSLQWNLTGVLNPAATGSLRFCVTQ